MNPPFFNEETTWSRKVGSSRGNVDSGRGLSRSGTYSTSTLDSEDEGSRPPILCRSRRGSKVIKFQLCRDAILPRQNARHTFPKTLPGTSLPVPLLVDSYDVCLYLSVMAGSSRRAGDHGTSLSSRSLQKFQRRYSVPARRRREGRMGIRVAVTSASSMAQLMKRFTQPFSNVVHLVDRLNRLSARVRATTLRVHRRKLRDSAVETV